MRNIIAACFVALVLVASPASIRAQSFGSAAVTSAVTPLVIVSGFSTYIAVTNSGASATNIIVTPVGAQDDCTLGNSTGPTLLPGGAYELTEKKHGFKGRFCVILESAGSATVRWVHW